MDWDPCFLTFEAEIDYLQQEVMRIKARLRKLEPEPEDWEGDS